MSSRPAWSRVAIQRNPVLKANRETETERQISTVCKLAKNTVVLLPQLPTAVKENYYIVLHNVTYHMFKIFEP